ncbi:MAG: hypothetical protein R3E96_16050 [Planctomycetota bacterium]
MAVTAQRFELPSRSSGYKLEGIDALPGGELRVLTEGAYMDTGAVCLTDRSPRQPPQARRAGEEQSKVISLIDAQACKAGRHVMVVGDATRRPWGFRCGKGRM